jgi:GNAT superfamily N-acetyltransferase
MPGKNYKITIGGCGSLEVQKIETFSDFFDCFGGYIKLGDLSYLNIPIDDLIAIYDVFVEDGYRGHGFGRQLMEELLLNHGSNMVLLADTRLSKTLPNFYKKFGFKIVLETKYGPLMLRES